MKKLKLDCGLQEYKLGAGVLRFNPSDPNLYARFLEAARQLPQLEQQLVEAAKTQEGSTEGLMTLLSQADSRMKTLLNDVFRGNDFDMLLEGVNLLAVADNGERVVTNLLQTLEPVLREGAEEFAQAQTDAAVQKARQRRGQV